MLLLLFVRLGCVRAGCLGDGWGKLPIIGLGCNVGGGEREIMYGRGRQGERMEERARK